MTILEAMTETAKMAIEQDRICYLREDRSTSFQYCKDWLFKAYPGGRKVLSMRGKELVQDKLPAN